ncbi:MAG TPA: CDP-glycerol glycerophosphotransferase family protein, partial [Candidatus Nesterenkonia stercoripullorum]|nr:CDP-glycerol glycerophosphotransferase family protein [Candidatus Nesterenkonia stercoripullorum]
AKDLRGFYLDMSELPGDVVHTQAEVEERLQDIPAYEQRTRQSRRAFRDRFDPWEDALAPAAALRIIRERIQGASDSPSPKSKLTRHGKHHAPPGEGSLPRVAALSED